MRLCLILLRVTLIMTIVVHLSACSNAERERASEDQVKARFELFESHLIAQRYGDAYELIHPANRTSMSLDQFERIFRRMYSGDLTLVPSNPVMKVRSNGTKGVVGLYENVRPYSIDRNGIEFEFRKDGADWYLTGEYVQTVD
jgi:hypothetical protein